MEYSVIPRRNSVVFQRARLVGFSLILFTYYYYAFNLYDWSRTVCNNPVWISADSISVTPSHLVSIFKVPHMDLLYFAYCRT